MKKILFLMLLSIFFLKLEISSAQDLPCSQWPNRDSWNACMQGWWMAAWWDAINACWVAYCLAMNDCHNSYYPSGWTYDIDACKASCDDIVAAGMWAWWRIGWGGAAIIWMINVNFCKNNCTSASPDACWDPSSPTYYCCKNPTAAWCSATPPVWKRDISWMNSIDRMYWNHDVSFSDNGFWSEWNWQCDEDYYGNEWRCVDINWNPTRWGAGCPERPRNWTNLSSNPSGNMTCRYRDNEQPPAVEPSPSSNNWQNLPVDIRITVRDEWGAGIWNTNTNGSRTPKESGYAKYSWSYQWDFNNCHNNWSLLNLPGSRMWSATTDIKLTQEWEHYLYICIKDNVWRRRDYAVWPYRYDATPPNLAQITETLNTMDWSPLNAKNILANIETDNYDIKYDEWANNLAWCNSLNTKCSPLLWMDYRYETYNNNNWHISSQNQISVSSLLNSTTIWNLESCPAPWTNCNKIWIDRNVSLIDNDDSTIDGERNYDAKIEKLCDAAWNCTTKDFSWNLYANTPNWWWMASYSDNLNTTWVADGQYGLFWVTTLKDQFGNKIIPVAAIGRNVQFNLKYNSDHQIDQYNKSWKGWVFFALSWQNKFSQTEIWAINYNQTCSMLSPQNCENIDQVRTVNTNVDKWKYYFRLLWFTPTHKVYDPAKWNNTINYFDSIVTDQNNSQNVDWPDSWVQDQKIHINNDTILKYKPLFYTTINQSQWSEWWWKDYPIPFYQNSTIFYDTWKIWAVELVLKNIPSDNSLLTPYVTWWIINLKSPVSDNTWKRTCARTLRDLNNENWFQNFWAECSNSEKNINKNLIIWKNEFWVWYLLNWHWTNYSWDAWSVTTHVATKYLNDNLAWYNNWIIWLRNTAWVWEYFAWWASNTTWAMIQQFEIKVIWMIWSSDLTSKSTMILAWSDLSNNFGWKANSKYTLTNNVRKKVIELTRWMSSYSSNDFNFSTQSLTDYNWFKILYKNNWWDLRLSWKTNNDEKILIIVVWWNVYIDWDIQQWQNWALWIIVLNWWTDLINKWNIYLHNDVTNLEAFMYTDWWIIRYKQNWASILTQESIDIETWSSNQVYIKWLLRVANTLWWSRLDNDWKCPYFIPAGSCTKDVAQRYDLKYLSRFYLYKEFDTDENWVQKLTHWYTPSWHLAWKIRCNNAAGTITCSDTDSSLTNFINPIWINNPFGWILDDVIPSKYTDYLWPIIVEYDPKVKTFNVPIFSSEI